MILYLEKNLVFNLPNMIYIIIPVFNRWHYTNACLQSLLVQNFGGYKIIVVDHGSTDNTSQHIHDKYPDVLIVSGNSSMWWTAATNLGVKKALELSNPNHDFVLTLNNDLEVPENYLSELIKTYQNNQPCFVGSTSVNINNPNTIVYVGTIWDNFTAKYRSPAEVKFSYQQLTANYDFIPSDMLTGRGTLIPIKAFNNLGLYDEQNFPHYMADEDFALRGKKAGYKILVSTKAYVKSHIEATGLNFKNQDKSLGNFIKSLTSIRSANNLRYRFLWAKKHANMPLIYFSIDVLRIFGSYLKSVLK